MSANSVCKQCSMKLGKMLTTVPYSVVCSEGELRLLVSFLSFGGLVSRKRTEGPALLLDREAWGAVAFHLYLNK